MGIIKWVDVSLIFVLTGYIEFLIINGLVRERKYERTHFPCKYIKGDCTVKPTWKNCSGGTLESVCERKLNNRL